MDGRIADFLRFIGRLLAEKWHAEHVEKRHAAPSGGGRPADETKSDPQPPGPATG
jgi:hypothetical protein